ncbi:MAG TPA: flagellar assembly protein FliW [Bacillota bacterium]|nr:flagellar assembly protein FliW [Bacillota bacterium]HOK68659.1 flagellar assembly protein FliW [Bacillota bacterium]HPP84771.1 flagellar assembly protein FliW [Bacillota bacterium]
MLIKTKDFEYIEISEEDIISFPNGVYGFEDTKKFVILKNPENIWMMYLQSAENEDPRFILLDPFMIFEDYNPLLPEGAFELLGASDKKDLNFFVVTVVPENIKDMTVNLKSPVVINFDKKIGAQVILENKEYTVRTRVFPDEGTGA